MYKIPTETIKACTLGHAVGDALGVPVEFKTREELDEDPVTDMRGFGTYNVPAGSWSDDTSMSLCALEALAREDFTWESVMDNFGRWYYKDEFTPTGKTFDVGRTCRSAIDSYFIRHANISECGKNNEHSNGNGSLMRIIPFALYGHYYPDKLRNIITAGSSLTHAHLRSVIACDIYSHILLGLIDTGSKAAVLWGIDKAKKYYGETAEWTHYKELYNIGSRDRDSIKSSGYVVDTLEAALWCLLTTESYRDCVLNAVNLGMDTDSVAAVAGGLAGALYGLEGIPQAWLSGLIRRDFIEKLCEKAGERWNSRQ